MSSAQQPKPPLINCHTHVFTGDHVPPWLAKKFLPFPFYYLLSLRVIVKFFRWWYRGPARLHFKPFYKRIQEIRGNIIFLLNRYWIIQVLIGIFFTLQAVYILFDWIALVIPPEESKILTKLMQAREWLTSRYLLFPIPGNFLKILVIIFVLLFIESGRNFIFFILKKIWSFLGMLPGKQTKEMFMRYLNIGRYAFHEKQSTILGKLKFQYPEGSGFVILPMDMEYMAMGKVKKRYRDQMQELAKMKNNSTHTNTIFPFVFADPRRIAAEPDYFQYETDNGSVKLKDCFIKEFITEHKFSGFKIYPALGYYPFDEQLLPLWKYAADQQLPVLTHCIRGTIFYRGNKKREWNHHPVFQQAAGDERYEQLYLKEMKNVDFQVGFTHPMNYLCLLEEKLLRKLVAKAGASIKKLFGYTDDETPLLHNLSHMKLCFGHFGGDDEWLRFFEKDRDNFGNQLVKHPGRGIDFLVNENGEETPGKPEQVWKYADWYSIICSLMQQYPNVYADISYILHNENNCLPLLKQTLQIENDQLRNRVLYGTDFYVVRNHKSDKNMLADMLGGLSEDEFDQIARNNPRQFLYSHLHGNVPI